VTFVIVARIEQFLVRMEKDAVEMTKLE